MSEQEEQLIDKIVEDWEERRSSGEDNISLAELCADHPGLLDEVRTRIAKLLSVDDVASLTDDDEYSAPESIGPYKVIRELGRGAVATVYLAVQKTPARNVAIKLFNGNGVLLRKRFEREAHILGSLDHEGIAKIYDFGRTEERIPYLVMEYVSGKTINYFVSTDETTTKSKLVLLQQVLAATEHAHRKGVIHRDLKPGNILVNDAAQAKVIDFGIAKLTNLSADTISTREGLSEILGTLPYMAPEQIDNNAVDYRADIYAIGVIAYELLTGQLPIDTRELTLREATVAVKTKMPQKLSTLVSDCPQDLQAIIHKSLEKNPADRYLSASDFSDDISRFLDRRPVTARQITARRQLSSWIVRHPAFAVAIALLATTVAVSAFLIQRNTAIAREQSTIANVERTRRLTQETLAKQKDEQLERLRYNHSLRAAFAAIPHNVPAAGKIFQDLEQTPSHLRDYSWSFLRRVLNDVSWSNRANGHVTVMAFNSATEEIYVGCKNGHVAAIREHSASQRVFKKKTAASITALLLDSANKKLLVGTSEGEIISWPLESPATPTYWRRSTENRTTIRLIAIANDDQLIAVDETGRVTWHNRQSHVILDSFELRSEPSVCSFDPTYGLLAFGTIGGAIETIDLRTKKHVQMQDRPPGQVRSISFYGAGRGLAEAHHTNRLLFWESRTGRRVNQWRLPFDPLAIDAPYDGNHFYFLGAPHGIHETTIGEVNSHFRRVHYSKDTLVHVLDATDDDRTFVYAKQGIVRFHDLEPWSPDISVSNDRLKFPTSFVPLSSSEVVVTTKAAAYLVDTTSNKNPKLLFQHDKQIRSAAVNREYSIVAFGMKNLIAAIDLRSDKPPLQFSADGGLVQELGFLNDGTLLAGTKKKGLLHIDLHTGNPHLYTLASSARRFSFPVDHNPFVACHSGKLIEFNLTGMPKILHATQMKGTPGAVATVDGVVRVASITGEISTWDGNETESLSFETPQAATALQFSPDAKTLIVGAANGDLSFIDAINGQRRFTIENAFKMDVRHIAFTQDSQTLLGIDKSGKICGWTIK